MKRGLTVFLVFSMLMSTTACAAEPKKIWPSETQSPQLSAANENPQQMLSFSMSPLMPTTPMLSHGVESKG